ncbi:MAG: hypothetical protein J5636_06670 [Clostridiales bacterium]|nr:hypothetical protein [Clostridiales bacterium]
MESECGRIDRKDILFLIGLAVCAVFCWIRCRFGLGVVDEAFFLSLGDKIYRGNAMLVHEWHASQFTFFLVQPLYWFFHLFRKNNEGIILFFRHAYVIAQVLAALFIYIRTRKYSKEGAGIASMAYLLFCPLLQLNFNYNSIAILGLHVALILVMTAEKRRPFQLGIAGVFFAAAVLCCPYLLAVYLIYSVIFFCKKKGKEWLWFTSGCALLAMLFFAFLISRASFSDLLSNATHVLDDPEHPAFSPILLLIAYVGNILEVAPLAAVVFVSVILLTFVFYLSPELRKKRDYLLLFTTILVIGLILEITVIGARSDTNSYPLNRVMLPINILVPICAMLYEDKSVRRIFSYLWVPGMLYGVCISFISNLGIYSICSASSVATTAAILIVAITYRKQYSLKICGGKPAVIALTFLFTCQIGAEVFLRSITVYPGGPVNAMTEEMEDGCEKGLFVRPNEKTGVEARLGYTGIVRDDPVKQKTAYITYHYWLVLEDWDVSSCTPSNLLTGLHPYEEENPNTVVIERLDLFYSLNPDRIPDMVYVDVGYDDVQQWYIDKFGFEVLNEDEKMGTLLVR